MWRCIPLVDALALAAMVARISDFGFTPNRAYGDLVVVGPRHEAFLVAVKRVGAVDALSQEFAREHSERLWSYA